MKELFESKQEIERVLLKTKYDEIEVGHIIQILEGPMLLDQFEELLVQNREEEGIMRTYLSYLNNGLSLDVVSQVLELFETHPPGLTTAKTALFFHHSFRTSTRSEGILDFLINTKDTKALSYLTFAVNSFSQVPVSIYGMSLEERHAICRFLGQNSEEIVDIFLSLYYISVIQKLVSKNPESFGNLNQYLTKTLAVTLLS